MVIWVKKEKKKKKTDFSWYPQIGMTPAPLIKFVVTSYRYHRV